MEKLKSERVMGYHWKFYKTRDGVVAESFGYKIRGRTKDGVIETIKQKIPYNDFAVNIYR